MGTKVHSETSSPGRYHHSMRDLNNDFNACSRLPLLNNSDNNNNNKTSVANDQSYRDVVRRTMLEHEATFKSQVLELHRVYGIQKDMMDELKRKQFNKEWCGGGPIEASCSSQATNDDDALRKWKMPSFPSMSVVEDNGHSPMKGNSFLGQVPWQNGATSSKHVEALEPRPTKLRRKMIDLCVPADEYIDDSEDVVELKDDHRVSQLPNGDSLRIGGYGSGSSRRTNGLADLNEPFKETNEVAYGSFQSHVPVNSLQPKAWPQQHHQPLRIDHKSSATTPFLQPGKPLDSSSQQRVIMGLHNNAGPPPPPTSKADLWRGKTFIDLEADDTNDDTNTIIHESSFASLHHQQQQQPRHLYPTYNPTLESAVPWNRLHSPWQNPTSFGFPQGVSASAQRYPVLNLSDTNTQRLGCLGDRLQFESNARGSGSAAIRSNHHHSMFYNECSSSSKPKGTGYSYYPNGGRSDHHSLLDLNGSEVVKSVRDLNLNVTLSNGNDEEHVATLPWLLKPTNSEVAAAPGRWNLNSNDAPSKIKKEEVGGTNVQNLMWLERLKSGSCSSKQPESDKIKAGTAHRDDESNTERDKGLRVMLDINEPCEPLSDEEDQQTEKQTKFHIDLNMSVGEDEEDEKSFSVPTTSSRLSSKRPMIDLETVPESEPSEETPTEEEKQPEFEKTAAETIVAISSACCLDREPEEAASPPETVVILHWFAETVDTHRENLDKKLASSHSRNNNQARSLSEIDYFESMTLQLPEITEEDYTPKPLVPEDIVLEETTTTTTTTSVAAAAHQRPRRGNARKGKQRRDFQRDILPGLVSLTKHEVTEDIQLFDGFMRAATGSSWTPTGLTTRKKTGARGRPRRVVITNPEPVVYYPVQAPPCRPPSSSVQQQHNGEVEMGFEDGSFGGWGKMTRRPRRQRCPSSSTVTTSVTNVHHHTRMSRDGWE